MTKIAVVELVGEPLMRQNVAEGGFHEIWRYTKSRSNGDNFLVSHCHIPGWRRGQRNLG